MGPIPPQPPPNVPDKPQNNEDEQEDTKIEEVPLPNIRDTFMLKGHEYRVVYINEGKRRFTCIPMKGVY